jgi:hypothetical protein
MRTKPGRSLREREALEIWAKDLLETSVQQAGDSPPSAELLTELKRCFVQLRPSVFPKLATYLADQQTRHTPKGRLFEDLEEDVGLWAHARAHGWKSLEGPALPSSLEEGAELISPLLPPRMEWGASGHLQNAVVAALHSPILHAWIVYREQPTQPMEIVITGQGISPIHNDVMTAVFATSLAVEPKTDDFVLEGVMRLLAMEPSSTKDKQVPRKRSFFGVKLPFLQRQRSHAQPAVAREIPKSAEEAILLLRGILLRLQNDTGLVVVNEVSEHERDQFINLLAEYQGYAIEGHPHYWHDVEAKSPPIVTTIVYQKLTGRAVQLKLSADLLQTESYKKLVDAYHNRLVRDIQADVDRRELFYQEELEESKTQKASYDDLPADERKGLAPVQVTHEVDFESALSIRMAKEKEVSAGEYYTKVVPSRIMRAEEWLEKMRSFKETIERSLRHPDSPLERICAARLFDCACRQQIPSGDEEINRLFKIWSQEIQPLLWCEWRKQLWESDGIALEDCCTRHTFFNLVLLKEKNEIILNAHTLLDSHRSVVLFDRDRKVIVVKDATDFAEQLELTPRERTAIASLVEAKRLSINGGDIDQIRGLLFKAMHDAPQKACQLILDQWLQAWAESDDKLDELLETTNRKTIAERAAVRALQWYSGHAFNAADKVLRESRSVAPPQGITLLVWAHLECLRLWRDPFPTMREMLDRLRHDTQNFMRREGSLRDLPWRGDPRVEPVWQLFLQAFELNPRLVIHFCEKQGEFKRYADPQAERSTPQEEGARLLTAAADAARVGLSFADATANLNPVSESRRSAYYKLGRAIEIGWAPPFAPQSQQLRELLNLLLGEELAHPMH